ncbi:MAG: glutamate--tRNA ligase [Spirochaetaceae bacterium]|nr:MAG: glutamate--tRNA ligase [Spirochaetaceae bacterium]
MHVRVRYAPSPTGLQHIGGIRTALFNYFFARARGGSFILRIEDTDRERYDQAALQDIYDTFDWLGIGWDEGPDVGGPHAPYFQSQRLELYRRCAEQLIERDLAYYAYDTPEELAAMREAQGHKGGGYDRRGRNYTAEQIADFEARGIAPVVRFKGPLDGETVFEDMILGRVSKKNRDITPDPVLLKSDGYPTYHLANVVDDHQMQISHILRAQEWIPSAPLHVRLYEAFGWQPPVFCHLPMVMGKDGQKLSKRHGSTSVIEFRRQGYLPEALINYVALLGWAYDDKREFFTTQDLERLFDAARINKAPAVFDYRKLEWFNGVYIRNKSDDELEALMTPILMQAGIVSDPMSEGERSILRGALPLIRERMKYLTEAPELVRFLFTDQLQYKPEELIPKKMDAAGTVELLRVARELVNGFEQRSDEENEERFRARAEELGTKMGNLMMPLRIAVTGSRVSPPLFGSMRLIGEQRVHQRIDTVLQLLQSQGGTDE